MVMEHTLMLMVAAMLVNTRMMTDMVMEHTVMLMVSNCVATQTLSLSLFHVHAIILLLLVLLLLLLYCILLIFYYQLSIIYCSISYNFNNTLFYILNLFKYQLSFIILYRRNFGSFEYVWVYLYHSSFYKNHMYVQVLRCNNHPKSQNPPNLHTFIW